MRGPHPLNRASRNLRRTHELFFSFDINIQSPLQKKTQRRSSPRCVCRIYKKKRMLRNIIHIVTSKIICLVVRVFETVILGIKDGIEDFELPAHVLCSDSQEETRKTDPSSVEKYKKSIVTIHSIWEDDNRSAKGTGFFVTDTGYIVTAGHLVRMSIGTTEEQIGIQTVASQVYVTFSDMSKTQEACIVSIDGRADICVLKIPTPSPRVTPLCIYDTYEIGDGDPVTIIGNAFGIDSMSVATGVVRNARWKDPRMQNLLTQILTDVSTSNGVSGAPIIDQRGRVVGIHTAAMHPKKMKYMKTEDQTKKEDKTPADVVVDRIFVKEENNTNGNNAKPALNVPSALHVGSMNAMIDILEPKPIESVQLDTVEDTDDARMNAKPASNVTSALHAESMNAMTDILEPKPIESDQLDTGEDARLSTTFGGGLAAPLLRQIVDRIIAHDLGHNQPTYSLTKKCMPRFGAIPNTVENRMAFCKQNNMNFGSISNRVDAYLVVALDDQDMNNVQIGDVVTHIDGNQIGLSTNSDAFGDRTWFLDHMDTIALTVIREHRQQEITHRVTILPTDFDIYINDPQLLWLVAPFVGSVGAMFLMAWFR